MDSVQELQTAWERMASEDARWAVLSEPGKKGGRWSREEFYATGRTEIDALMAYAAAVAPDAVGSGLALDFGCGVGRLTQPLAAYFDKVIGVDISPTMIEQARREDASDGRCEYVLNPSGDLACFADATFDLIYSNITLQHMRPRLSRVYVREFVRILKPGGLLVFQLPTRRRPGFKTSVRRFVPLALRRRLMGGMEMHGIPEAEVIAMLESAGARVLEALPDQAAGPYWHSRRYAVTR